MLPRCGEVDQGPSSLLGTTGRCHLLIPDGQVAGRPLVVIDVLAAVVLLKVDDVDCKGDPLVRDRMVRQREIIADPRRRCVLLQTEGVAALAGPFGEGDGRADGTPD